MIQLADRLPQRVVAILQLLDQSAFEENATLPNMLAAIFRHIISTIWQPREWQISIGGIREWCPGQDLNLHTFR